MVFQFAHGVLQHCFTAGRIGRGIVPDGAGPRAVDVRHVTPPDRASSPNSVIGIKRREMLVSLVHLQAGRLETGAVLYLVIVRRLHIENVQHRHTPQTCNSTSTAHAVNGTNRLSRPFLETASAKQLAALTSSAQARIDQDGSCV